MTVTNNSGYLYKTGYAFNGWNTAATPSGSSTHYDVGGTISSIGADVTLYAEWVANDYTMYFFNKDSWSSVYAYMWDANNDPEKAWHGRAMTSYQSNVYKIDYRHDVQKKVNFNNNASSQINDLTIADGQTGDNWFYNDADKVVITGGIHHGWSQYILVANFPTSTVAAVVGEKVTVVPTVPVADAAVRGSVGVLIFGAFTDNTAGVALAAILLWLLNTIVPTIVGTLVKPVEE